MCVKSADKSAVRDGRRHRSPARAGGIFRAIQAGGGGSGRRQALTAAARAE